MQFRVSRSTSFRRAIDYVMHDKDARTSDRVGLVQLMNLGTQKPAREMQDTADIAHHLRGARSGEKTAKPVYSFSLSWHPDDKPTPEHMAATAREALQLLGMKDHQALIVQHTERPHCHVHVIVNLVHPENGRVADLSYDTRKLADWAHAYELSRTIRSPRRAAAIEGRSIMENPDKKRTVHELKATYAAKAKDIKDRHAPRRDQRETEKADLKARYLKDREDIYDKAQIAMNEARSRTPRTPELTYPPPKLGQAKSEAVQLAKALKPYLDRYVPRIGGEFKQAGYRIAAAKASLFNRAFRKAREGEEIMLPVRNTPEARMFARANGAVSTRQSILDERGKALAARDAQYRIDRADMRARHSLEIATEKREWRSLKVQADKAWDKHRADSGLKPREVSKGRADFAIAAVKRTTEHLAALAAKTKVMNRSQERAAATVNGIMRDAQKTDAPHRHLERKQLDSRDVLKLADRVVIPMQDREGVIRNVQTIDEKGTKRFVKDAPEKGLYHVIGDLKADKPVMVCSSYETGLMLAQSRNVTAVVAIRSMEMKEVAKTVREQVPDRDIKVVADRAEDFTRQGMQDMDKMYAQDAAREIDADVIIPQFGVERGADWADYAKNCGQEIANFHFERVANEWERDDRGLEMPDRSDDYER